MKNEVIKINGMSCGHCVMAVKRELSKLDIKITEVKVGSAEIIYDENKVQKSQIENSISEAGFEAEK